MAAQDELELLERVFLRVGSAETDDQLENVVFRFLPPVLLKLSSAQEGVRKKVLELLVHINKRLKSRPKVQLPVEPLLVQYQDPSSITFVTNFTILYLKMGYPRLKIEKQAELAPSLIQCLEGKPPLQQDSILQMVIPTLPHLKLPGDPNKRKAMFGLSEKPATVQLLLDFMMDFLLLPYTFTMKSEAKPDSTEEDPEHQELAVAARQSSSSPAYPTPPGLSANSLKRVLGEGKPDGNDIEQLKVGIIHFLSGDIMIERDVICHLIIASSDTRYSVATAADLELKRIQGSIDWNAPVIVSRLYGLFQGSVAVKGQAAAKPEDKRQPVSTRVRLKIFPYFLRSREAADHFPASIQVVFDCLYGTNTNNKLKTQAVQFVHHLCTACSNSRIQPMGPILLSGMSKLIAEAKDNAHLRSLAYIAVGKLSKRLPHLFIKDLALLQQFFVAVCEEEADVRLHVQEALSLMSAAYSNMQGPNVQIMEVLIMSNIEKSEPQARLTAVQYASTVFPGNHIPSRYALLLATGDIKEDIHLEAEKALKAPNPDADDDRTPWEAKSAPADEQSMPKFADMVKYIQEKASQRIKSSSRYVIGTTNIPFRPETFNHVIFYLRSCLLYHADVHPDPEMPFDLATGLPKVSKQVTDILAKTGSGSTSPVLQYIGLMQQLLSAIGGQPIMYCLLEVVAVAADKLEGLLLGKLPWILNFMRASREEMRTSASQLYAIVANSTDTAKLVGLIKELTQNTKDQFLEFQHGSLLALGYTIGRHLHKKKLGLNQLTIEDMETNTSSATQQLESAIAEAVKVIVSFLDNSNTLLCTGACVAIGEIGRNGCLPIPNNGPTQNANNHKEEEESTAAKKGKVEKWTKALVVEKLVAKLESNKVSTKLKEQACTSLGYLPVGDPEFPFIKDILEGLIKSANTKQIELHFSVGEALSHSVLGTLSPAGRDIWTEEPPALEVKGERSEGKEDWVGWLLDKLLKEDIQNQNPHKRQAACVWLLSLVKHCGVHPALQARITSVQQAFVRMLSENDEFTQDAASKGLSLVYEQSTAESRKDLVSILVDTLMTGKRAKQTVTGDTTIFQEGALGQAPKGSAGGNLSTYKELCSLASDLNQPDLVYKFMHLANHNAMWNSRKGAAFGFSTIAAQAGEQLAQFLPNIVPKLYRYQYDPSGQIRQAMSSIWSALVKDNKKVVDTYLEGILNDLLVNLTSHLWRNRESSCLALSDLLRGRNLDDVVDYLPNLWESCFKVLDDIKESVRKAAEAACRSLSKVSVKMCDLSYGKVSGKAIALVLPCLLKTGLPSSINEVRSISLGTIVQISKKSSSMLKPHIPVLVTALLEALSGLEPQMMNYLSLHLGKTEDSQEKLDNMRISASKSSPMMETIMMCVQYVDPDVLSELIPRINDLIRSGIGVGTKAGCANVLIMLSTHCPLDLTPFSGKILGALLAGLSDKSVAVRKMYGNAIGHVVKIAKDSSVEKLLTRLKTWYMEKDDEGLRTACGATILSISRYNPDVLKKHAALVLPLVFLAMHEAKVKDSNNEEKELVWEEIWLDSTPGTESGIKLYLVEIISVTKDALGSQSWPRKAQAARAMGAVAKKLSSGLHPPHLGRLLSALIAGLTGRTWDGKEELLKAIAVVCTTCRQELQKPPSSSSSPDQPKMEDTIPIIFKECKKDKIEYKMEALRCIGAILKTYQIDRFKELTGLLFPILRKEKNEDDSSSDEENDRPRQALKIRLEECSYECLGMAWPHTRQTQDLYHQEFCQVLCEGLDNSTFKNQVAILKSLGQFLDRLVFLQGDLTDMDGKFLTSVLMRTIPALCKSLGIVKYLSIRKEAIIIVDNLLAQLQRINETLLLTEEMRGRLDQALGGMQSDTEPALRERAAKLRKAIQQLPKPPKPIKIEADDQDSIEIDETSDLDESNLQENDK